MGLTKSQRIIILLIIDTVFFVIELSVGYAVHSLALVADAFHMLNDVLSLCVGLWAVRVANEKSSKTYTYGWQRAETLGALINGVFLVALCLSIFLEAINRFVEPQEVQHPKLICIVGGLGLFSNILGLLLFHDHSHGHGGHGHAHEEPIQSAEQGYTNIIADQGGSVASVMPETVVGSYSAIAVPSSPSKPSHSRRHASISRLSRDSRRYSGFRDAEDINGHPASLRQDIIQASRFEDDSSPDMDSDREDVRQSEESRLLPNADGTTPYAATSTPKPRKTNDIHNEHNHAKPKGDDAAHGHGHGHSHGHSHDLNMRGVFLHVMGDALGNIGVIVSALIIWLTNYSWRYYADPAISLLITIIILFSAIPLCKAASRILLQAVPAGLSIDHIIEDIEQLPGIISCHHFHVWQLSDTKLVASLHIQVSFDIKGEGSDRYMSLARHVRKCLHAYGIHSSTIQPEFYPGSEEASLRPGSSQLTTVASESCLLECGDDCAPGRQCCPSA
ncbi:Zinc resistance conferring protein [Microsporum audouinii]